MTCESEREFRESHGETKHSATARLIDDLLRLPRLLPPALCGCDVGGVCAFHAAIYRVVERAHMTGKPQQAKQNVERFVERLGRQIERMK